MSLRFVTGKRNGILIFFSMAFCRATACGFCWSIDSSMKSAYSSMERCGGRGGADGVLSRGFVMDGMEEKIVNRE